VERRSYPPGEHGRGRMRQSEYRVQLREKQKAKRYYGGHVSWRRSRTR
jgi:small subunit ribosomal protein S4